MILMMMTGFVIGMIVTHVLDSRRMEETVNEMEKKVKEAEENASKAVNVYIPKRNIKSGEIPLHSYVKENFIIEDGFMAYYNEAGEKISHLGVDLSYHNKNIDWDALSDSPVEFVMLRCAYRGYSEGGIVEDEKFREYAQAALEHGLKLGVYFFTQAINEEEAIAEAKHTIKLIEEYDISYPVAIDTEYIDDENARTNVAELTPEELSNICIAFCETIKEAGYYPMVYASENWFRRKLDTAKLAEYDFWAPQYLDTNDFLFDFTIWQYTDDGSAPGVEGPCDLNISLVDYASFVPKMREAIETGGEISTYSNTNPNIAIAPAEVEQ